MLVSTSCDNLAAAVGQRGSHLSLKQIVKDLCSVGGASEWVVSGFSVNVSDALQGPPIPVLVTCSQESVASSTGTGTGTGSCGRARQARHACQGRARGLAQGKPERCDLRWGAWVSGVYLREYCTRWSHLTAYLLLVGGGVSHDTLHAHRWLLNPQPLPRWQPP